MADIEMDEEDLRSPTDIAIAANTDPNYVAPALPVDPVADQFTWENGPAPQFAGTDAIDELQMPMEIVGSPGFVPGSPSAPQVQKQGASGRASVSRSGTPGWRGIFAQADAATAADQAANDKRFAEEDARARATFEAQKAEVGEMAGQERDHYTRLLDIQKRIQDYNETQAELEYKIHQDSKVHRDKILADYTTQLAGVRALSATTGNPLGGLGGGQMGALGGAMFAQGFLAAQGININVTGQVDKWVDRSIQEHQLQIQNARQNAADTLHLYDIARQTSEDNWEARQRFRGFVIQGFQSQIQLEAARFGSSIANANASAKIAELQGELDKTLQAIGDRKQAQYIQYHTMHLNEARAKATAAHEAEMASIGWMNAKTNRMEADTRAKAKAGVGPVFLPHPGQLQRDGKTNRVTGLAKAYMLRDGSKGLGTEAQKHLTAYSQVKPIIDAARELRKPAQDDFKERFGPNWSRRYSDAYRAWEQQKNLLGEQLITALTGAAAPEEQMNRIRSGVADDSIWGSNAGALDITEKFFKDRMEGAMRVDPNVHVLSKEEQAALKDAGQLYDNTEAYSESEDQFNARYRSEKPLATPVNAAKAPLGARDSNKVERPGFSPSFWDFAKANDVTLSTTSNHEHEPGQTRAIDTVDRLTTLILDPSEGVRQSGTVDGQATVDGETVSADARKALERIAAGEAVGGKVPSKIVQQYAKHNLQQLDDPWAEGNRSFMLNRFGARIQTDEADAIVDRQRGKRMEETPIGGVTNWSDGYSEAVKPGPNPDAPWE